MIWIVVKLFILFLFMACALTEIEATARMEAKDGR